MAIAANPVDHVTWFWWPCGTSISMGCLPCIALAIQGLAISNRWPEDLLFAAHNLPDSAIHQASYRILCYRSARRLWPRHRNPIGSHLEGVCPSSPGAIHVSGQAGGLERFIKKPDGCSWPSKATSAMTASRRSAVRGANRAEHRLNSQPSDLNTPTARQFGHAGEEGAGKPDISSRCRTSISGKRCSQQ